MKTFTVIALFADNAQLFATSVEATDPAEAMSIVALQLSHADANIIGCVEGKHTVHAPCEDAGKIASVDDMPIDSETWLEAARQAVRANLDANDMIWHNLWNSLGVDDVDPEDLPAALGIDGTETVEALRAKLVEGLRNTSWVDLPEDRVRLAARAAVDAIDELHRSFERLPDQTLNESVSVLFHDDYDGITATVVAIKGGRLIDKEGSEYRAKEVVSHHDLLTILEQATVTELADAKPLVASPGISRESWDAAFSEELKQAFPGFRNDGDVSGADLVEWIGIRFGQFLNNE